MPKNAHPDSTFASFLHNDWTLAQTGSELKGDDGLDFFMASENHEGAQGGYDRVVPDRFTEERDDQLMNSIIKNYALETKGDNGRPSGHFFVDKSNAQALAAEVKSNHQAVEERSFNDTWNHFDVNGDGLIEVERMPQFLRYMLGNALAIGL